MDDKQKTDTVLFWMKVQTGLLAGILVVLLVVFAVGGAAFRRVTGQLDLNRVNAVIISLERTAEELEKLDAENLNATVTSLRGAADRLSKADMDAVNDAIASLSAAADQLSQLDMQELNALIDSLQTAADQLESVTGGLSRFFKK